MPAGALLFQPTAFKHERWTAPLRARVPTLDIRTGDAPGNLDDIVYCVAWKPEPGSLAKLKNLKVVFSMGAGVDAIVADKTYPRHVPLSRVVDPTLTQGMTEYVVMHVLMHHRRQRDLDGLQRAKKWRPIGAPRAEQVTVGIMGLGVLGLAAAQALAALNYKVVGWSATRKNVKGVESFAGDAELGAFLGRSEILVCLLPLTPTTTGILNAKTFAQLPKGACVVNCGRGGHLIETDLVAALDGGHLRAATLDVFQVEPLPEASPLWTHPKVTVTPHVASLTDPESFIAHIADTIARMDKGLAPENLVDFARGY